MEYFNNVTIVEKYDGYRQKKDALLQKSCDQINEIFAERSIGYAAVVVNSEISIIPAVRNMKINVTFTL